MLRYFPQKKLSLLGNLLILLLKKHIHLMRLILLN